jgi:hypothetical protein
MAELFHSTFEIGNITEWTGGVGTNTVRTTNPYAGSYADNMVDGGGSGTRLEKTVTGASSALPWYATMRMYRNAAGDSDLQTIFYFGNDAGELVAAIKMNTDGTLRLFQNTGQVGSASSAITASAYNKIGLYASSSGAVLSLEARLNGVMFASTTSGTLPAGGDKQYLRVGELNGGSVNLSMELDEIIVDDATFNDASYVGSMLTMFR